MTEPRLTDRDLQRLFAARTAGAIDGGLADRISRSARQTRQRSPFLVLPGGLSAGPMRALALAATLSATVLLLAALVIVPGRGPTVTPAPSAPVPPPSGSPSGPPSASPSSSPTPTATAAPTATPLPPGTRTPPATIERPRVGGLGWLATPTRTLYADHSESAEQLGELPSVGTDLFFIEGPVESEGYVWWRVQAYDTTHPSAASAPIGWVISAVVNADEPPVLGYVPECPSGPINAEDWQALPSYIALACFGSQPVTVEGRMTCSLAEVDGTITGPDWLQSPVNCQFATADGTPLGVVQGGWPEQLSPGEVVDGRFAVTGHLDDPQAGSCVSGGGDGGPTTEQAVQLCRQLFVRDSISRLDG